MFIASIGVFLNLEPPQAPSASVEAVSLPLRLSIRYGQRAIDVKATFAQSLLAFCI
jgi:hypothetical protein